MELNQTYKVLTAKETIDRQIDRYVYMYMCIYIYVCTYIKTSYRMGEHICK